MSNYVCDSTVLISTFLSSLLSLPLLGQTELNGMREAHLKDGAAVVNFLSWLETELIDKKNATLDECSVADKLETFRSREAEFVGLSFETISSVGGNASIIHYKPEPASCKKLTTTEIFLLDSGGQYKDGTTDITRTVHFGSPSAIECETFTRVLKGHIALAQAVFPPGTVGPTLDAFARSALWQVGLDYVHGTGHGVGAFLNVHEGPIGISPPGKSQAALANPLQTGMIISNGQKSQMAEKIYAALVLILFGISFLFFHSSFLPFFSLLRTGLLSRWRVRYSYRVVDRCTTGCDSVQVSR